MRNLLERVQCLEMIPGTSETKDFHISACVVNYDFTNIYGIRSKKDIVLVKVEGDNMEPTIFNGDVIICQRTHKLIFKSRRSAAVIISRVGIKITRLYKHACDNYFWLKNDNPLFATHEELNKDGILQLLVVYGKMNPVFMSKYSEERIKEIKNSLDSLKKEIIKIRRDFNQFSC